MRWMFRKFSKHWKRNLAILLVLFLGVAFAGVEYTGTSRFCGTTCHIMATYHVSWKNGTHKDVACVDCHIPPGATSYIHAKLNGFGQVVDDWLNRTSTKPSASVSDFACLRSGCHVVGDLGEVEKEGRPYKFDHAKHLDLTYKGLEVHCTTCHSHVQGDTHFEVNTNACVACHLIGKPPAATTMPATTIASADAAATASGAVNDPHVSLLATGIVGEPDPLSGKLAKANCDACHNAPANPIQYEGLTIEHSEFLRFGSQCNACHRNATARPPPMEDAQCLDCHDFGMERFTNTEEIHKVHTIGEHKVECFSCHGVIRHGPQAASMSLEQFECQACHKQQHMVQRSAYLRKDLSSAASAPGVSADTLAVSPMFLVHVDCTGCHIRPGSISSKPTSGATVARAVPEACDACHQKGLGAQMVPMWQRNTHELYDGVMALMPTDANSWADGNPQAMTLVSDAQRLLDLVRVDGSWGVHNPRYTQKIIEQARQKALDARKAAGLDQKPSS
jgi:nitrate/TMAO reductase-like tetraheme cytochrome c subunit